MLHSFKLVTGIGFVTAREMAKKGARVIATTRSIEKGKAAFDAVADEIKSANPKGSVELMQLDLTSMANVKSFTEKLHEKTDKVDILVLNAGIMMTEWGLSKDGYEQQFATVSELSSSLIVELYLILILKNHIGHFLLVKRVEDLLLSANAARIVVVSSIAHMSPYPEGIKFETLKDETLYNKM